MFIDFFIIHWNIYKYVGYFRVRFEYFQDRFTYEEDRRGPRVDQGKTQ